MGRRVSPERVWGGLFLAGLVYEFFGLNGHVEGGTLSEVTRKVFRTHHPVGKAVFVSGWALLTAWFVPHIVRAAGDAVLDAMDAYER